jgi:hypothetical protein
LIPVFHIPFQRMTDIQVMDTHHQGVVGGDDKQNAFRFNPRATEFVVRKSSRDQMNASTPMDSHHVAQEHDRVFGSAHGEVGYKRYGACGYPETHGYYIQTASPEPSQYTYPEGYSGYPEFPSPGYRLNRSQSQQKNGNRYQVGGDYPSPPPYYYQSERNASISPINLGHQHQNQHRQQQHHHSQEPLYYTHGAPIIYLHNQPQQHQQQQVQQQLPPQTVNGRTYTLQTELRVLNKLRAALDNLCGNAGPPLDTRAHEVVMRKAMDRFTGRFRPMGCSNNLFAEYGNDREILDTVTACYQHYLNGHVSTNNNKDGKGNRKNFKSRGIGDEGMRVRGGGMRVRGGGMRGGMR